PRVGGALQWVRAPSVAQRVCPKPQLPRPGEPPHRSRHPRTRPASLRGSRPWPFSTATPAEAYPRYSRRVNPSRRTGTAFFGPTYPTIPHIAQVLPRLGSSKASPVTARPNRASWASVSFPTPSLTPFSVAIVAPHCSHRLTQEADRG